MTIFLNYDIIIHILISKKGEVSVIDKEFAIMFGIIAIIFAIVICILLKKGVKKTALVCIFIALRGI